MAKPFKIPGDAQPQAPDERFPRPDATPPNPLEQSGKPKQWAPGIGQGSAETSQGKVPWPAAGPAVPGGKPFKLGG